ncbi:hypothetical protein [Roseateles sp.]|uniref:hypothetical protein n=1 Tax=Roseateles sp. TaxID=1971397 RepID=UPI003BA89E52
MQSPAFSMQTRADDGSETTLPSVPDLVGQLYEDAPIVERGQLLEQLLRPLGILSLFAISNGVFAKAKLRGGWHDLHVRFDDIGAIHGSDVADLAAFAQQVSAEAMDGLARFLTASPVLLGSATAALLISVLARRRQERMDIPAEPVFLPGPAAPGQGVQP